ncbi:MAG: zinc ABC transporter ATP-binding protein [Gammaproteobacteria bacterium 39-13]|nr:zinc ABC transporter ATP-binding protein ZnuC [Gammaproteobacteria bacterium]OJV90602.1 MAG: zinc ABC transporter ATP-binding protein [Gammaproteobacteria bacterium 39-13]
MTTPIVNVEKVSLFDGKRQILKDVSLALMPGEIVSVIGPNGAGKTTLVKVIVGLIKPTLGKVTRQAGLRIGYMPQRLHVDPIFPLTVERFLQLGQTWTSEKLERMLAEVGVHHVLHSPLQAISGGELQRVLLARALLREPQLLVLDEPAQGVDLIGQGELYDLIGSIRDRHQCTILLVSHDLNIVMARTGTVVCLNQHICCSGLPEQVSRDPAFAALFGKAVQGLAFYTHKHDHHHHVDGAVVTEPKEEDHD